jgi:hypothetical protein
MKAIEMELGHSLDRTRNGRGSHIRRGSASTLDSRIDNAMRGDAMARLRALGVDTELFEWPASRQAATAA